MYFPARFLAKFRFPNVEWRLGARSLLGVGVIEKKGSELQDAWVQTGNLYYKRAGSSFPRRCHSEERSDEESRLSAGQSLPKLTEGSRFLAALGMTVGRAS